MGLSKLLRAMGISAARSLRQGAAHFTSSDFRRIRCLLRQAVILRYTKMGAEMFLPAECELPS